MKHLLSILILLNLMSVTSAELTSDNTKPEGDLKYRLIMCTGEYSLITSKVLIEAFIFQHLYSEFGNPASLSR